MASFAKLFSPRDLHAPKAGAKTDKSLGLMVQAVLYQVPVSERPTFKEVMLKAKTFDQLDEANQTALKGMLAKLPPFSKALLEARLETSLPT